VKKCALFSNKYFDHDLVQYNKNNCYCLKIVDKLNIFRKRREKVILISIIRSEKRVPKEKTF